MRITDSIWHPIWQSIAGHRYYAPPGEAEGNGVTCRREHNKVLSKS